MTAHTQSAPLRSRRRQPEVSRNAILQAALIEFAREGLAGARMDAIAKAAGVNKALLYYYFNDKEALYGAILDRFFEKLAERVITVCHRPGTAGERFLSYVRTHFDSIAESPYHASIFMSELMAANRGGPTHLDRIFGCYMQPIAASIVNLLQTGIRDREFRPVDPYQFMPSVIGAIVHYFLTAPLRQKFMPELNANSVEAMQQRRGAVLDFIAAALFIDREKGIKLAAKIARASETSFGNRMMPAPPEQDAREQATAGAKVKSGRRGRRAASRPATSAATLADATRPPRLIEQLLLERSRSRKEGSDQ